MTNPFVPFDEFDQEKKLPHKSSRKILDDMQGGFDGVQSIVAGTGITVDSTDPSNPVVSAPFSSSGSTGIGGNPIWVKAVAKHPSELETKEVVYTEKNVFGAIQGLVGNSDHLRITIGALPGSNGKGGLVSAYCVAGSFTPSFLLKYPEADGEPISATFTQMRVNDEENTEEDADLQMLDHAEFTVDLPIVFEDGEAQVVITTDSGSYVLLSYVQEDIAQLTEVGITTEYSDIDPNRTGFTSGDTLTISFTATAPVYQIFVWAHDVNLPSLTRLHSIYEVEGLTEGEIEITLAAEDILEAFDESGVLFVSAGLYDQPTKIIQTTSTFIFDERSPAFSTPALDHVTYTYPIGQEAIKGAEQATVTISNISRAGKATAAFQGSYLSSVTAQPYDVVDNELSFTVTRATPTNGAVSATVTIYNTNNFKSATSPNNYVVFSVEDSSFDTPTILVNNGFPITSAVGGKAATISITSEVRLANPSGQVAFPGMTFGGFSTSNGGYEWHVTGTVSDSSVRGLHVATISGTLLTAAGTEVTAVDDELLGNYTISGFDSRAVTISTPYADTLSLGSVVVDYPAGLVVKDPVFNELVYEVDWDWVDDEIVFLDPAFYNANVTGTLFVYVSQDTNPGL